MVALAAGLYGQLVRGGNLALSPFSAAVALGMTVNGAAGGTRDEMLAVLGATDVAALDDGLNALTAYVESLAGRSATTRSRSTRPTSSSASAGDRWEQPFLDALARSFGAGLREVDFEGATEAARTAINGWTAEQTHDRIAEIVPVRRARPGDADGAGQRAVLQGAVARAVREERDPRRAVPPRLRGDRDVPMMNGHASAPRATGGVRRTSRTPGASWR